MPFYEVNAHFVHLRIGTAGADIPGMIKMSNNALQRAGSLGSISGAISTMEKMAIVSRRTTLVGSDFTGIRS
jgi:hypothetical protein